MPLWYCKDCFFPVFLQASILREAIHFHSNRGPRRQKTDQGKINELINRGEWGTRERLPCHSHHPLDNCWFAGPPPPLLPRVPALASYMWLVLRMQKGAPMDDVSVKCLHVKAYIKGLSHHHDYSVKAVSPGDGVWWLLCHILTWQRKHFTDLFISHVHLGRST